MLCAASPTPLGIVMARYRHGPAPSLLGIATAEHHHYVALTRPGLPQFDPVMARLDPAIRGGMALTMAAS
jgi:hypothetical protein